MKHYQHIFFDLDRTLYDFDKSNRETLQKIYQMAGENLTNGYPGFAEFYEVYKNINKGLWDLYKKQELTKQELNFKRFSDTLRTLGLDSSMAKALSEAYIDLSPLQVHLIPGTTEILQYLYPKYQLHIITNGFAEIQYAKLHRTGLAKFFRHVIVSEEASAQKPDSRIFSYAFQITGANAGDTIVIGDDPHSDIYGGINAGVDQVWLYKPGETSEFQPTYAISDLLELKGIL